jgi:hypothetical protein
MIKFFLLILGLFIFSGCVNKHGISAKYYSDCKEYYDLQGYYHKECGEDDIVTYKEMGDGVTAIKDAFVGKKKNDKNVW